jgi:hypothetical protein
VELDPGFADAHFRLGSLLSENGMSAQGFCHYLRRAELVHGQGSVPSPSDLEPQHKIKHDREQREYLAPAGSVPRRNGPEAVFSSKKAVGSPAPLSILAMPTMNC